jgi:hypothetical protein
MTKHYRQFPANMMDEFYDNGQANTNKILSVRELPVAPSLQRSRAADENMPPGRKAAQNFRNNGLDSGFSKLMFQFQ